MSPLTAQSFIRQLPNRVISTLEGMLDPEDLWVRLAEIIPQDPEDLFRGKGEDSKMRYSTGAIAIIRMKRKSKTRMLLEDWGTQNCQLRHLIKALFDAHLYEAANYLSQDILHLEPVPPPDSGNEAEKPTSDSSSLDGYENGSSMDMYCTPSPKRDASSDTLRTDTNAAVCGSSINTSGEEVSQRLAERPENDSLLHMQYGLLSSITGKFNSGKRIGSGGFGDVFLGCFCNGLKVAVKRLKNNTEEDKKQFDAEIKTLGSLRHENLVILLGYSFDGELQCLVYQYMTNGSLEDRLARLDNTPPLSVAMRVEIARGTAKGIDYLHSNEITHRDIKSPNILLNEEFVPKIGDFATARAAPNGMTMTTQGFPATAIIGTQPYLAPEAYDCIIQFSLDIFSFGVVLQELITGLQALDTNREERDLKQYVMEYCTPYEDDDGNTVAGDIYDLRDKSVDNGWSRNLVESLYKLSLQCLMPAKKQRIKMHGLLEKLEKIYET